MSSGPAGKGKKGKKMSRVEIIPENAEYEENIRSLGDETPSDDTGEQEEISARKRKRDDTIQIPDASSKDKSGPGQTEVTANPYAKKQRKKKSRSWQYLDEYEVKGEKWVRCKLCQTEIKRDKTCSTTQLNRHVDKCKVIHGLTRQTQLQFQKSGNASEVTLETFKYDHAEMRKTVAHYILINELPFMHVESFMFNEVMRKATPLWQKISRATVKADCVTTYEIEKKKLKEIFKSVPKINITTDMWTSSNQKLGYMVVTSHWIDSEWKLNMRVLNFCNVPPPHSGYIIAEALNKANKKKEVGESSQLSSSDFDFIKDSSETPQGLNDYESFIRDSGAIQEPLKRLSRISRLICFLQVLPQRHEKDKCNPISLEFLRPEAIAKHMVAVSTNLTVVKVSCACLFPLSWSLDVCGLWDVHDFNF
ncbi:hypothetical protein POM88_007885 [Heracleum sosnowskyi]|uniref:BED-type domain-containing protein n=1 Tax=Heracleum sosnowskyi TaxID=360622 RepID=A0AAD8J8U8_9APIA|nr:hypothetical protein POM88_007885 [Heracleum sosnowskyi]